MKKKLIAIALALICFFHALSYGQSYHVLANANPIFQVVAPTNTQGSDSISVEAQVFVPEGMELYGIEFKLCFAAEVFHCTEQEISVDGSFQKGAVSVATGTQTGFNEIRYVGDGLSIGSGWNTIFLADIAVASNAPKDAYLFSVDVTDVYGENLETIYFETKSAYVQIVDKVIEPEPEPEPDPEPEPEPQPQPEPEPQYKKGDVNGDGKITATDYVNVKFHVLGKLRLSGTASKAADVNGDGKITATDYVNIKFHVLGKIVIKQ